MSSDINPLSAVIDPVMKVFNPEPHTGRSSTFEDVLEVTKDVVGGAISTAGGIDPTYIALINKQIETQQQMQLVSFESNIEKSKHETQMVALRNIRVG